MSDFTIYPAVDLKKWDGHPAEIWRSIAANYV